MREQFERWVRDHHAAVWRSAWRVVRNAADASDVTQEVFVQAWRRAAEVARTDSPANYLRWLAVKTALAQLRGAQHRRHREEEHAMQRHERTESQPAEARELERAVQQCVATLPDDLRLATVLRFQEGLTFAQLGDCLGIAEPTAFDRVKRAVARLRERLAQLGHAAVLTELESWLGREETIAVPAGLASSLLALAVGGGAATTAATTTAIGGGAAVTTAAAAVGATATSSKPILAIAATLVAIFGGGAALISALQDDPARGTGIAPSFGERATVRSRTETPSIAATRTEAARDPDAAAVPAAAPTPAGGRRAREFLTDSLGTALAPGAETADPILDRIVATGHVIGRVVDDDGRTVAHASVSAWSSDGAGKGSAWQARGETDEHGEFALEVAIVFDEGQRYSLHVTHAELLPHRTGSLRVLQNATTDAGAVPLRRITTDRVGDYSLAVRVRDADNRPVEGAWVKVYRRLGARPDPAEPTTGRGGAATPDAADSTDFTPDDSGWNAFRGSDANLADANWEQNSTWEAGVQTDATGTAVVAGHHIGAKWVIVAARHLGKPDLRQATEVQWTGFQEIELALPKTTSICGRLLFPPGTDIERESVGRLYKLKPGQGAFPLGRSIDRRDDDLWTRVGGCQLHAIDGHSDESVAAEIAADGSFTIPGLVAGAYRVVYRGTFAEAARFDVPAGATGVELELKARNDPRPIGHHLAEIHAHCIDVATGAIATAAFGLERVPDGAKVDDASLRRDHLPALAGPPRPYQTLVAMQYEIVEEGGELLAVAADPFARADRSAPTEMHSTGLEPGSYIVVARAAGYAVGLSRRVTLARDTIVADLVIELHRPASVRGRVIDASGRPLTGAIVFASGAGPTFAATLAACEEQRAAGATSATLWGIAAAATDADGRFELGGLHPRLDWALGLLAKGHPPTAGSAITLEPGGTLDVGDLPLPAK